MIGIVIPVHNEERLLGACLDAAMIAARHPGLNGEEVAIVVVLDDCTDGSADIVARHSVERLAMTERNVGAVRAAGAQRLLTRGARWLAFTDADSRVAADWLHQQHLQCADVVFDTVAVEDWSDHRHHATELEDHFRRTYSDADGHRHVHGANLGLSAEAYRSVGGFPPLASSEDVALVEALGAAGVTIAWSAAPRVVTSARRMARAPAGFATALCHAVDTLLLSAPAFEQGG